LANPIGVGDTLVLTLSPATSINRGLWTAGSSTILTWEGQQQAAFPSYTGRASVDTATGTLTLRSVTMADAGVYTVRNTEATLTASTSVTVLGETGGLLFVFKGVFVFLFVCYKMFFFFFFFYYYCYQYYYYE